MGGRIDTRAAVDVARRAVVPAIQDPALDRLEETDLLYHRQAPPVSEREAVELGDVGARDLEPVIGGGILEVALDDLLRVWARGGVVRIVGVRSVLVYKDGVAFGETALGVGVGSLA